MVRIRPLLLLLSLLFSSLIVKAQTKTITGKVTSSDNNNPMPGVSVLVKGTQNGTITDQNGQYVLKNVPGDAILVFSSISYQSQEVQINGRDQINITLKHNVSSLDQVVVIGYGTQRELEVTGSISTIPIKEIKDQPMMSVDQLLQGRGSGVQVTQTSNAPGEGVSVRIRGSNSILSSSEPLYVIDGVPTSSPNGMPTINPDNIKSIDILKDASATAIYGSRGANGVVLITTKEGMANQNNISIKAEFGIQEVSKYLNLLDAKEFATLANEAISNDNLYLPPDQQKDLLYSQLDTLGHGTDWERAMYRVAKKEKYSLAFTGGTNRFQYAITGHYANLEGLRINNDIKHGGVRVNLKLNLNKQLVIGEHLTLKRIVQKPQNKTTLDLRSREGRGSEIGLTTIAMYPTLPIMYPNGTYSAMTDIPRSPELGNPVQLATKVPNKRFIDYILGNFYAEYNVMENLKAKLNLGIESNNRTHKLYRPIGLKWAGPILNGYAAIQNQNSLLWLMEGTLTYNKIWDNDNKLNILAGFSYQNVHDENDVNSVLNFGSDFFGYNNLGAGSVPQNPSSGVVNWKLLSYFGRLMYNKGDKYLVTGSLRADGSSKFGKNNQFGFFPSVSVGWIVSNEPFLNDSKTINFLKLRASYGSTGNQNINPYGSYGLVSANRYPIGSNIVVAMGPATLGNPDLEWERTTTLDFGLDNELFNSRIRITIDYYHKKTTNLLLNINIPSTSGFTSSLQNIGSLENRGWELDITGEILTSRFSWTSGFNISSNRSKVLNIGNNPQLFFGSDLYFGNVNRIVKPGHAIGSLYGYVFDGLWQTEDEIKNSGTQPNAHPGDPKFKDLNNDGVINAEDRKIIGESAPRFIFGFSNRFKYKNFSLSIFLQGNLGNDIVYASRLWLLGITGRQNNSKKALNRWTPSNKNTDIPRASYTRSFPLLSQSDWMLEDGSYLRINNVRLSYKFTPRIFKDIILFFDIQNLYTLTNYSGYDPDVNTNGQDNIQRGEDNASYPLPRSYVMGINIDL